MQQNQKKGHPGRFQSGKRKSGSQCKAKTVAIALLPGDLDCRDRYRVDQQTELMTAFGELLPAYAESDIRCMLTDIFKIKYPLITPSDFEFVKKEKNVISMPATQRGFKWTYDAIKTLIGQGKLYCR